MKGLQQQELADLLGVNENSIVNWEKDRGTPIKSHIKRAIEVLGLSPKQLLNIRTFLRLVKKNYWILCVRKDNYQDRTTAISEIQGEGRTMIYAGW
jgi:transcriptional regulator with XRE-family HTH domain